MNKYQRIAAAEQEVKQLEIDACWAIRGREVEKSVELRKARREKMNDIARIK